MLPIGDNDQIESYKEDYIPFVVVVMPRKDHDFRDLAYILHETLEETKLNHNMLNVDIDGLTTQLLHYWRNQRPI